MQAGAVGRRAGSGKKRLEADPARRFAFRLALHFGCTVRELAERMDSAEFGEWIAFAALEPFGSRIEDLRAGTIATAAGAMAGVRTAPGEWFRWGGSKVGGSWRDIRSGFGAHVQRTTGAASG